MVSFWTQSCALSDWTLVMHSGNRAGVRRALCRAFRPWLNTTSPGVDTEAASWTSFALPAVQGFAQFHFRCLRAVGFSKHREDERFGFLEDHKSGLPCGDRATFVTSASLRREDP